MTTWLLDTNVLVYAIGDPSHPLSGPARGLVRTVVDAPGRATTTSAVMGEFLHVYARRRDRRQARDAANAYGSLLGPLMSVPDQAVGTAAELFATHDRLDAFDAILAAVVLHDPELELVSADRAFESIPDLAFRRLDDGDW